MKGYGRSKESNIGESDQLAVNDYDVMRSDDRYLLLLAVDLPYCKTTKIHTVCQGFMLLLVR